MASHCAIWLRALNRRRDEKKGVSGKGEWRGEERDEEVNKDKKKEERKKKGRENVRRWKQKLEGAMTHISLLMMGWCDENDENEMMT